jgi:hypothetical protein
MNSKIATLFANAADEKDLAQRWDDFQNAMLEAPNTAKGDRVIGQADGGATVLTKAVAPVDQMTALLGNDVITKSLSADVLASITTQLEQANVNKDFTLTSPLSTGYVAYDLEAPAKMLYPRPTPVRNKIPRAKGVGVAHQYKKITGISGAQGGPKPLRPGITDSTTTNFGSLALNRGQKIVYAGSETSVPYLQFGLSDSVPFSAQFAGAGFMDARSVSQSSVLYASMLSEERLMLGGRGTAAGFAGALAQPTGVTAATRAAVGSEVPISGGTTSYYTKVTAVSIFGESVLSAAVTTAVAAGVLDVTIPDVPGALGYNVYVGTGAADPGDAARWLAATGGSKVVTVQGPLPTSGVAASSVTADTSASAQDYDGILTICSGAGSGYVNRINAAFSTASPGSEFQTAFGTMYQNNLADPDEILLNGFDRKQLSDLLKTSAGSSNYRIQIQQDGSGQSLGNVVVGLVNEVTGKMVDLTVHPYLPQGNAPILSHTLPFADSNVDNLWTARNVQDYMAIQWPVIQNSYDTSSYWFGTFYCYGPAWQGIVQGIKKA